MGSIIVFRVEDSESGALYANTHLRIHWLIRKLTFDRCDLNERTEIFTVACNSAQVGWLTDFTRSSISDHFPRKGKEAELPEKCLVLKEYIPELKRHATEVIENAASNGQLINHPQLRPILFGWSIVADDNGDAVKSWTDEQMRDDKNLSKLAHAFTSESWSHGIGMVGLGDRVAMRNIRACVDTLDAIINLETFRKRLEEVEKNNNLDKAHQEFICVFLEAWRKEESGV